MILKIYIEINTDSQIYYLHSLINKKKIISLDLLSWLNFVLVNKIEGDLYLSRSHSLVLCSLLLKRLQFGEMINSSS